LFSLGIFTLCTRSEGLVIALLGVMGSYFIFVVICLVFSIYPLFSSLISCYFILFLLSPLFCFPISVLYSFFDIYLLPLFICISVTTYYVLFSYQLHKVLEYKSIVYSFTIPIFCSGSVSTLTCFFSLFRLDISTAFGSIQLRCSGLQTRRIYHVG
jgi:hypothetical protein